MHYIFDENFHIDFCEELSEFHCRHTIHTLAVYKSVQLRLWRRIALQIKIRLSQISKSIFPNNVWNNGINKQKLQNLSTSRCQNWIVSFNTVHLSVYTLKWELKIHSWNTKIIWEKSLRVFYKFSSSSSFVRHLFSHILGDLRSCLIHKKKNETHRKIL